MRTIVGMYCGTPYKLVHDILGNQMACDDEDYDSRRWFVWTHGEYLGNFETKLEAMRAILYEQARVRARA